jgi:hypothetical protein
MLLPQPATHTGFNHSLTHPSLPPSLPPLPFLRLNGLVVGDGVRVTDGVGVGVVDAREHQKATSRQLSHAHNCALS